MADEPVVLGFDPARPGSDTTALTFSKSHASYVCRYNDKLGQPISFSERNGRIVIETESGIPFIVPTFGGLT